MRDEAKLRRRTAMSWFDCGLDPGGFGHLTFVVSQKGNSAMHLASFNGHIDAITLLLAAGGNDLLLCKNGVRIFDSQF